MANEFIARNGIVSKSNLVVSGSLTALSTITAQTLVVQTITSSISSITGSTNFGTLSNNTHTFTGSMSVSGSGNFSSTITSLAASGQATIIAEGSATNGEGAFQVKGKNSSGTARSAIFKYDNADILRIGIAQAVDMRFETNDIERMRITSGGLVAIGNSNPSSNGTSAVLDIGNGSGGTLNLRDTNTGIAAEGFHQIYGGDNRMYFYAGGSGASAYMQFYTNDAERMRISSDGKVGIGITNPTQALTVYRGGGSNYVSIRGDNNSGYDVADEFTDGTNYVYSGLMRGSTGLVGAYSIYTGNGPRVNVTSGGAVYINATTNPLPDNATPQFAVLGGSGTDAVSIKHTVNGNNTFNIWQTGTTQHNAIAFYKGDTQANRGNIVVTTSGTSYNTISDYRLKENIVPLENGLDRVLQLKPSKFNWIETGNETEGFIAHELQEYFPDAVTGEKDAVYSSTGNIKPQSVDYGRITPLLVKAIQELTARVQELENK